MGFEIGEGEAGLHRARARGTVKSPWKSRTRWSVALLGKSLLSLTRLRLSCRAGERVQSDHE